MPSSKTVHRRSLEITQESPEKHSTSESLESLVPLHVLCDRCQDFAGHLDRVDFKIREKFKPCCTLCTVEQLLEGARECHLCQLIVAVMHERNGSDLLEAQESIQVFLALNKSGDGCIQVSIRLTRDAASCSPQLEIFTFNPETDEDLPPPLRWTHIPAHAKDDKLLMREWLHTCLSKHNQCRTFLQDSFDKDQQPTRVIDVANEKIRLLCNTSEVESFEYLTLSHMWGPTPSRQVRLVQENLTQFESHLPTDDFSFIYKEAIRVTRNLGYRYLWIDSLCIIQDSVSDWQAEASKMASIYGNATCNLSYLFPPGNEAVKGREDPRSFNPCILLPATKSLRGLYVSRLTYIGRRLSLNQWPLLSRGWAFQELMLCPRNIFLGEEALIWECSELFRHELFDEITRIWSLGSSRLFGVTAVSKSDLRPKSNEDTSLTRGIVTDPMSVDIWWQMSSWEKIVLEYRSKALTNHSDRTIAFAGIARAVHKLHGLTYLAGLWKESFPKHLAWGIKRDYLGANVEPLGKIEECGVSTAPSWSWFSAPIRRGYMLRFPSCEAAEERERYISWIKVTSSNWEEQSTHRHPDSLFYDFTGLLVTVELMTLPGQLVQSKPTEIKLHSSAFDILGLRCRYYHDDVSELLSSDNQLPNPVILGLVFEKRRERQKNNEVYKHLRGLVLTPFSNGKTWRRVGVWSIFAMWDLSSPYADETSLFDHLEGGKTEKIILV